MSKFYGAIGYAIQEESVPGVWVENIIERYYRGDILKLQERWQASEHVNDNLTIDNKLSIISDPFAYENLTYIRYVIWMGVKWKIKSIEINRPRLTLYIGGVYNE